MQTEEQRSWILGLSPAEGEECLTTLHGLAGQVEAASNAVVRQDLAALHNSLALQEVSCRRLANLRYRSGERLTRLLELPEPEDGLDSNLLLRIKSAAASLLALNRGYSALLTHSGDTLRLLAGLYRSYYGSSQPTASSGNGVRTWSCEL